MLTETTRDFTKAIQFDWHSYFEDFDAQHGGEPVVIGETRLLYRDGWQYSLHNVAGPEWSPEELDKQALQTTYWETRVDLVTQEIEILTQQLRMLGDFQQLKSGDLKVFSYEYDEDSKTRRRTTTNLDLEKIESRIGWLREDLSDCTTELNNLRKGSI